MCMPVVSFHSSLNSSLPLAFLAFLVILVNTPSMSSHMSLSSFINCSYFSFILVFLAAHTIAVKRFLFHSECLRSTFLMCLSWSYKLQVGGLYSITTFKLLSSGSCITYNGSLRPHLLWLRKVPGCSPTSLSDNFLNYSNTAISLQFLVKPFLSIF